VKDLATKNTKDTKKAWPLVRLGDVCENSIKRLRQIDDEEFEYIDISSIDRSLKTITECKVISRNNAPSRAQQVIEQGDVLVSTVRPNLNAVAMVGEKIQFQRIGSTGFCVLRAAEKILPSYIFRVVQTEGFINSLVRVAEKAAYPSVTDDEVKAFQFPLPPLTVQREIVARLEKELGEADKLAAKFKRVAELADDAFKAELDETFKALEGERVRLGQVEDTGRIILGRGKIISKIDINACPGDYPVYSSSAMGDGEIGRYGKYMFDDKRITWSIDGGGRLFYRDVARYSVTNVCGWLKVVDPQIDTKYLYYGLTSAWLEIDFNYVHKAHPSVIRNEYYVALPPASIQRAIVAKLDAAKERCEKLKAAAMRGHAAAENLRKAILAEAFEQ